MITRRPARERGHSDIGWLNSWHTFSFSDYHDPAHMGFRTLRVINDDRVAAGMGFGTHLHRDMEIISYVVSGELAHKDSMGNGSTIVRGDVQYMSAGTGVLHSEFNPSPAEGVHFLQIWVLPTERGAVPRYGQKNFSDADKRNQLRLAISSDGRAGSVAIRQDVDLYAGLLDLGNSVSHALAPNRNAWLQIISGTVDLNGQRLDEGDGASISNETSLAISAISPAEILLFDLN
jgi:quercetin 2,3-dioxygenase